MLSDRDPLGGSLGWLGLCRAAISRVTLSWLSRRGDYFGDGTLLAWTKITIANGFKLWYNDYQCQLNAGGRQEVLQNAGQNIRSGRTCINDAGITLTMLAGELQCASAGAHFETSCKTWANGLLA